MARVAFRAGAILLLAAVCCALALNSDGISEEVAIRNGGDTLKPGYMRRPVQLISSNLRQVVSLMSRDTDRADHTTGRSAMIPVAIGVSLTLGLAVLIAAILLVILRRRRRRNAIMGHVDPLIPPDMAQRRSKSRPGGSYLNGVDRGPDVLLPIGCHCDTCALQSSQSAGHDRQEHTVNSPPNLASASVRFHYSRPRSAVVRGETVRTSRSHRTGTTGPEPRGQPLSTPPGPSSTSPPQSPQHAALAARVVRWIPIDSSRAVTGRSADSMPTLHSAIPSSEVLPDRDINRHQVRFLLS